jgi:hypothetical protein
MTPFSMLMYSHLYVQESQTNKSGQVQPKKGSAWDKTAQSQWVSLIKDLEKKEQIPVVCFAFSKKR